MDNPKTLEGFAYTHLTTTSISINCAKIQNADSTITLPSGIKASHISLFRAISPTYARSSWKQPQLDTLVVMLLETGLGLLENLPTVHFSVIFVRGADDSVVYPAEQDIRQCLRSPKYGAEPSFESRGLGSHKFQERECVRLTVLLQLQHIELTAGLRPREAAVTIVQLINSRNPNVSLLALAVCISIGIPRLCSDLTKLLDICVKNCGYPFHLQISTKEFLNELVRRFPERPPIRPSKVQSRILEAIEEWRQTICQTSRYKEDLGFIRDMHRLLLYKGYMFPEVRREDAAVLNPSDVRCSCTIGVVLISRRTSSQPKKWKKRSERRSRQSCKS